MKKYKVVFKKTLLLKKLLLTKINKMHFLAAKNKKSYNKRIKLKATSYKRDNLATRFLIILYYINIMGIT
jgi:hypothetical protein